MEITITRGLAELKTLNDRIEKSINQSVYIGVVTGKKILPGFKSNEEFEEKAKSNLQSVQDLIKRRNKIKSEIVKSNACTFVTVAGEKMTVAEAIERKSSISYEQKLLDTLKAKYADAINRYEAEDYSMITRLDSLLEKNFEKDIKATPEQYEVVAKPFIENNQPKLIDPLNIKNKIEELEKRIEDFLLNVDFVLSESNTTQKINIPD